MTMLKVLLVDDEPIVKIALKTMIDWDKLGFPICATASDGEEALQLVEIHQPDIIITDLKMPRMDGLLLIKTLNELAFKGKIIVASNFGEYELVREALLLGAMDYILKISVNTENLISTLQKASALLLEQQQYKIELIKQEQALISNFRSVKNTILKDFFINKHEHSSIMLQHNELTFYFYGEPFYLLYISMENLHSEQPVLSTFSTSFIENLILDMIKIDEYIEVFSIDHQAIIALISLQHFKEVDYDVIACIERIQALIKVYVSKEPTVIYSDILYSYLEAKNVYIQSTQSLQLTFYESRPIIYYADVSFKRDIQFTNYVDFAGSLMSFISHQDSSSLSTMLNRFIEQCAEHAIHPHSLKAFFHKCLDYIPLCDSKISFCDEDLYEKNKDKVLSCSHKEELLNLSVEALLTLVLIDDSSEQSYVVVRKEIKDVMQYVNEHYQDKISLEMIAAHVNFSENYLCRVFREHTGTSLVHYINNVRMSKASELILQGNTYMKEIANAVGLSDQFYFSRMFKKHYGVSPTEYLLQQKGQLKKTKLTSS